LVGDVVSKGERDELRQAAQQGVVRDAEHHIRPAGGGDFLYITHAARLRRSGRLWLRRLPPRGLDLGQAVANLREGLTKEPARANVEARKCGGGDFVVDGGNKLVDTLDQLKGVEAFGERVDDPVLRHVAG